LRLKVGRRKKNAENILKILKGTRGAKRDITVLNAASAFMIAGRAKDFNEGIELANQSIDSGEAFKKLERLIKFTNTENRFLRNPSEGEMGKYPGGH